MPAKLLSDTPDVSMVHQSTGEESNAAKATIIVIRNSANVEMPDVGRMLLVDAKTNELQQEATDATIAAMQCDDGVEAEEKVAKDGPVPKGTAKRWLTQVQNIEELVPDEVLTLCNEATLMIQQMTESNVVWAVHHMQKVNVPAAASLFYMTGVVKWNPDPHKDDGVAYNTICRGCGTMIQNIYDEPPP